jgi:Trypsin.
VALATHLHVGTRLKKVELYISPPLLCLHDRLYVNFNFYEDCGTEFEDSSLRQCNLIFTHLATLCLKTSAVASRCRSNELSVSVGPYSNDIGLIKVRALSDGGISFNSHVRPICLPELQGKGTTGSWCSVTGWGAQRREY